MPRAPQDIYARLLLSPRGYPLWTPEPSNELLEERRDGLKIGDVGVVLDDGGFDVLFNLTLPPDHAFHLRHGVPLGFTRVDPDQLDIRTIANAEPPGYVISSSSVTRDKTFVGSSSEVSERHDSNNLPYKFNLSSNEGALLILPQGAERYDLRNENVFLEQATLHAAEWYNYAVGRRGRIISADALYPITGIHKTMAWSVAAFENASENEHHTAQFKQIQRVHSPPTYRWETTTCAFDWRAGPYIDVGIPNQAVFIRGFKIAIRSGFLGTRWVSVEADAPSTRFNRVRSSSAIPGSFPMFGSFAGFLGYKDSNVFRTTTRSEGIIDTPEEHGTSSIPYSEQDSTRVEIQRIPDVPPVSHPSDAINQYLFRRYPSANIAITHDNHWISLLESASLTYEELRIPSILEMALAQDFRVVSDRGAVYLKKMPLELANIDPPSTSAQGETGIFADPFPEMTSHDAEQPVGDYYPPPLGDLFVTPFASWDSPLSGGGTSGSVERNSEFNKRDIIERIGSALQSRQYTCEWITVGQVCNALVHGKDFPRHLRHVHGTPPTDRSMCRWIGCSEQLKPRSIVRHVEEKHLAYRWTCPTCSQSFTRKAVMEEHYARCGL